MDMDLDPGLLPLDPEALDSVVQALRIAERLVPQPMHEDTVDRLLTRVGMTFHDFIATILIDPLRSEHPESPVPAICAAKHALTIADLLAILAMQPSNDAHDPTQIGGVEHPRALSERWLEAIVDVCLGEEDPPWHATEAMYAVLAAGALSTSARVLIDEPRLSLDPDDPCIRVRPLPEPSSKHDTPREVAVMLVWCAASALCMAAAVQPTFRFGQAPTKT